MQISGSIIKLLKLSTSKAVNNILLWNYKTNFKWTWIEFADIREYEEWDSFKAIDWTTSAKQWKLYIKKYQEERQLTIFFLVDIANSMQFGIEKTKLETAIETLYIIASLAIKNNDKFGAILFDQNVQKIISPKRWKKQLAQILWEIEKARHISKNWLSNIEVALEQLNKLPYKNSLIFSLTDDMEINNQKVYQIASLKNDMIFLNIFDQFENTLKSTVKKTFDIIDDNWFLNINVLNKKKVGLYAKIRSEKIKDFCDKLESYQIRYSYIDNNSDIAKILINCFQKRK